MITTTDLLVTKYNLLKVQFAIVIDAYFTVLWQSEQMHKLSFLDENNRVNFLNEHDKMWQYFLMQLKINKRGNLMLPIIQCCKESNYHIYGTYDDDHQVFVLSFTLISESQIENHEHPPQLLNYFQQGIILTTINHSIVHFNQNAAKMIPKQFLQCGVSIEPIFSQQIVELQNPQLFNNAIKNKENFKGECSIQGHNVLLSCFFNEVENQYIYMFEDRSDFVRLKKQLDERHYLSEIGEMASTLVHEMRNPMTSIKGYVDLMLMEQKPNANYMSIIERELGHLTQLCSDILFLAKPIDKYAKAVDLLRIAQEVIELMEVEVVSKSITLNLHFDKKSTFIVSGNEMYFKQVILNVIKNAIQAIDDEGAVEIVLTERIHSVELSVKDTGCGIPKHKIDNIFEMFFTTKEYGTGLGLPVVKKVIDQLRGTIEVKSTENIGTKFTISLPTIH